MNPPESLPALTLAYIGDAVYELETRKHMITQAERNVKDYNAIAFSMVCASAQSGAVSKIMPFFTEDEQDIYRRGRNAKSGSAPKSASVEEYRNATGLEAVFGYLYLDGQYERIAELFRFITDDSEI